MQKHYSFVYSYEAVVSPEEADEGAGLAEHEGDREGDGEEYVLVEPWEIYVDLPAKRALVIESISSSTDWSTDR